MKLEIFFRQRPVFTNKEFADYLSSRGTHNVRTRDSLLCIKCGFTVRRIPQEHAGGKWILNYKSALGQGGVLHVDFNFVHRIPLWAAETLNSRPLNVNWEIVNRRFVKASNR